MLYSIEGLPPRLDRGPFEACTFAPRCTLVEAGCQEGEPELLDCGEGRQRRCILPVEAVLARDVSSAGEAGEGV